MAHWVAIITTPAPNPINKTRINSAPTSTRSPAPIACAAKPAVPMRRNPNIQYTAESVIAPAATAAIGAACALCPTTPVSTMPINGTVAFEITMGTEILSTRAWVIVSAIPNGRACGH